MALNISDEILRAERLGDWHRVVKLAPTFEFREPSDITVLTAIIDVCLAKNCSHDITKTLRGTLANADTREFAESWAIFSTKNPRDARTRFEKLANSASHSWVGYYGLLRYAMESNNATMLRGVIASSERLNEIKIIAETGTDARIHLALLLHDYKRLSTLLGVPGQERRSQLLGRINYLIWSDHLAQARSAIHQYVIRFGEDYDITYVNNEFKQLTLSPDVAIRHLDNDIRKHPNYWGLLLARVPLMADVGLGDQIGKFLKSSGNFPSHLAYARLLRDESLVAFDKHYSKEFLKNVKPLSIAFVDYPLFHVMLANAHYTQGNISAAIKSLEYARAQTEVYPAEMILRAIIVEKAGSLKESFDLHKRLFSATPNDISRKLSFAYALHAARDYRAARKLVDEILQSKRYVPPDSVKLLSRELDEVLK